MNKGILRADIGVFVATLLLTGVGIVLVYSSSFPLAQYRFGGSDFFLTRHVVRSILGLVCFMVFINIDYHLLGRASNALFVAALALLVAVLALPESMAINGAKRWIQFGPMQFQVSDFARIALVLLLARQIEECGEQIREPKVFVKLLIKIGMVCGLIFLEPNFSTAFIIGCIGFALLYLAGARFTHIGSVLLVAVPVALIMMIMAPYRRNRILGFLHKGTHQQDLGYQAHQALIGLGNGGLFGVGIGGAERKMMYMPEPHTDFVFSVLGEEIGFVGLLLVLAIFAFVIYRGLRIAQRAPDRMGQVMAAGFTLSLALYVILHTCVNTGLLPTTGVPMPFLSYGGMSLVFTMSSMGILINISSQANEMALPFSRNRQRETTRGKLAGRKGTRR